MGGYVELAQGSSMRLCLDLEKTFPDLQGWQLELMRHLWFVAYYSEIYYGVCEDAWLRTTISLEDSPNSIFSEGSPERDLMAMFTQRHADVPTCQMHWGRLQELHPQLIERVKIHSNILPREAYREQLFQELQLRQPFWSCLLSLLRASNPNSCILLLTREFYPVKVLVEAVEERKSVGEKKKEWRRKGSMCELATHLKLSNVPHVLPRDSLRNVEQAEVYVLKDKGAKLGLGGADGEVYKVSWRNGIYARKKFRSPKTFEKECKVSLKGSHPHVIHPFGECSDGQGNHCLLMEVLSGDLHRFAIEKDFTGKDLQPADRVGVLLQIARGMEFLHDKKIVHGDLKPKNILISQFEVSEDLRHLLVKVTDFGDAQFIVKGETFQPAAGTTTYAAPEVLKVTRKEHHVTFSDPTNEVLKVTRQKHDVTFSDPTKIDIYSFGVTAYEVLTGITAYKKISIVGKNLQQLIDGTLQPRAIDSEEWQGVRKRYPLELIDRLESCWEFEPSKRPSFSELCEVLQRSKSRMQLLERRAANLWRFLALCLIAFICAFVGSYIV